MKVPTEYSYRVNKKKQKLMLVSLCCKSHRFKTANSKVYVKILRTETSCHVYESQ